MKDLKMKNLLLILGIVSVVLAGYLLSNVFKQNADARTRFELEQKLKSTN